MEPLKVSHNLTKFGGHRHRVRGGNGFGLSHNVARQRDKKVMWLYGKEPIKASIHPAKSGDYSYSGSGAGDYSYSGSGVVMALVCHVISEDRVITGSCDFTGRSHSW